MRAIGGQLKDEVVAFKKRRILEVAAHLFFEHGYEGTTLDALAEALQVTTPYLYSYFRNKGEILFEVCQVGIQEPLKALEDALAHSGTPSERLRSAGRHISEIVIEKREYIVVYQRNAANLPGDSAAAIREIRNVFDAQLTGLLEDGVAQGEFEVDDVGITATTIVSILSWLPNWYRPDGRLGLQEVRDYTVDLILRLVARPSSVS